MLLISVIYLYKRHLSTEAISQSDSKLSTTVKTKELSTLLKIKLLQKNVFERLTIDHFWFHKEPFSQSFFKKTSLPYLFIIWRTFFHHKEPFVKQKGSSHVKGSLRNHLDKNVILWHRETPLFLKVQRCQEQDCRPTQGWNGLQDTRRWQQLVWIFANGRNPK